MSKKAINEPRLNVLPLKRRPHDFLALVRELSADSKNVKWSRHARDRFGQRDITNRMALDVLRMGQIRGDIVAGKNVGEWKAKIVFPIPGRREVGVVTVVEKESRIFVKTVEWED